MAKEILQKTTQIKFAKWKEFVIFVIKWSNILMEKCQKLHLEKKQLNCDSPVRRSIFIQVKKPLFFQKHLIHYSSHLYVCRPVLQHSESLTRTLSAIDQLRHEFPILRKWRQFLTNLIPRLANILVCFERILVCLFGFISQGLSQIHRMSPPFIFLVVKKPLHPFVQLSVSISCLWFTQSISKMFKIRICNQYLFLSY